MAAKGSRIVAILSIIGKDITMMSREVIFVFLTVLSLVVFGVLYWVLPDKVDDTISIGVHGQGITRALAEFAGESEDALGIQVYPDIESLRAAVTNKDIEIGLDFPDELISEIAAGNRVTVTVIARPSLPPEITGALTTMAREIAFAVAGDPMPVAQPDEDQIILGFDRGGEALALRDRMRPLYAFMMLIMEAVALGALIASEIQHRTVTALLASPAHLSDVLIAKLLMGTLIAFTEAVLMLIIIRGFGPMPGIVLLVLFLGAIMVSGVAMIAGSAGKDLLSTMMLSLAVLIPLAIPAFAVIVPGAAARWVRILPSYSLIQTIVDTNYYGAGWADSLRHLLTLAGWCAVITLVGVLTLRGRVKRI